MKLKNIVPQTMYPADQMIAGMLINCCERIDDLENELEHKEKTIDLMSHILTMIGNHMELKESNYRGTCVFTDFIYPDEPYYKDMLDILDLKMEEKK